MMLTPGVVVLRTADTFVTAPPPVFCTTRLMRLHSLGSTLPLPFPPEMALAEADNAGGPRVGVVTNIPRPWVTATSLLPSQNNSSTETLAGPSLTVDQV